MLTAHDTFTFLCFAALPPIGVGAFVRHDYAFAGIGLSLVVMIYIAGSRMLPLPRAARRRDVTTMPPRATITRVRRRGAVRPLSVRQAIWLLRRGLPARLTPRHSRHLGLAPGDARRLAGDCDTLARAATRRVWRRPGGTR